MLHALFHAGAVYGSGPRHVACDRDHADFGRCLCVPLFLGIWSFRAGAHADVVRGEVFGLLLFFVYCALIIGGVHFTRQTFARYSRLSSRTEWSSGVIFSLEDGQAWASWPGNHSPVRLGPEEEVSAMMEDFIAQVQLGKHLNGRYTSELMQADR